MKSKIRQTKKRLVLKLKAKRIAVLGMAILAGGFIVFSAWYVTHIQTRWRSKAMSGTIYYVSPSGSNVNSGLSIDQPFQTLTYALTQAVLPGNEIHLLEGVYQENITISNRKGTKEAPIIITGESKDPSHYPILDGGDPGYTSTVDNPLFLIQSSQYLNFERLKIINSTLAAYELKDSHYITVRRNIIPYHKQAIKIKSNSSHVLAEFNEMYQEYPKTSTWTNIKSSKWEGGAVLSYGGAGVYVIRNNFFHDMFNGVLMTNPSGVTGTYYDNNVWIYSNRFENILDDPFEPETFAENNHFFNNTVINAHRLVSLAPVVSGKQLLGPIYIYTNYMRNTINANNDSGSNSALKIDLSTYPFTNGVYVFNNTIDIAGPAANTYAVDTLNTTIKNLNIMNNIFQATKSVYDSSALVVSNSTLQHNLSSNNFIYPETNRIEANPMLVSPSSALGQIEDGRLQAGSPAIGSSSPVFVTKGFATSEVVVSGNDMGAYAFSTGFFHTTPEPVYVRPIDLPSTVPTDFGWPEDRYSGFNPQTGPNWQTSTPLPSLSPSPTPQITIDTTPPEVIIKTPVNGTSLKSLGSIIISAEANDTLSGVKNMQIQIDGKTVKSCTTSVSPNTLMSCSFKWNLRKVSNGTHAIKVVSSDLAPVSNQTSTSITVYR